MLDFDMCAYVEAHHMVARGNFKKPNDYLFIYLLGR